MAKQGSYPMGSRTLANGDTVTGVVTGGTADVPVETLREFVVSTGELNPDNETAPGSLDGSETWSGKKSGGWARLGASAVASFAMSVATLFQRVGTGAIARTPLAKLLETIATIRDYGATTSLTDNSAQISNAITGENTVRLPDGTYNMTNFAQSTTKPLLLVGDSKVGTVLSQNSSSTNAVLTSTNLNGARISNMTLSLSTSQTTSSGHPISLFDVNDAVVRDVNITGLAGSGSAILAMPEANPTINDVRIEDVNVTGNLTNATNNNGPLIVNGAYCMMRGIHADSINEFSVEYKNATVHSIASDIISSNSYYGLYYGNTSTPAPQYCAASNIVAYNCGGGLAYALGSYNVASNIVVHNTQKWPSNNLADGVRMEAGSVGNSVANALFVGVFNQPIHNYAQANYVSGSFQNTGFGLTLEAGASQNVTAVNHPGARSSIYSGFVQDNSGQALSGTNSNPVYCHATGEYLGILGSRWRWVFSKAGSTIPLAEQKWAFESAGQASLAVVSDGTAQNGFMVTANGNTRQLLYTWSSDFWQLGCASNLYRFYGTSIYSNTDNAASLGVVGNRWSNIYSMTATLYGPIALAAPTTQAGATYSQGVNDATLIFNGTATQTLTLLSPATYAGRILNVKNTAAFAVNSASSNVVPLAGGSAGTAILAAGPGKWATLQSDGTNWIVIAGN